MLENTRPGAKTSQNDGLRCIQTCTFSALPSSPVQSRNHRSRQAAEIDDEMDGIHTLSLPITLDSTIHKMHSITMYKTYKCADVCLDLSIGSLFESYPWQIHNSSMDVPWSFFEYDSKSKKVPGVWTYNMDQHFSFSHSTYTISDPCLSHEFHQSIQITKLGQT